MADLVNELNIPKDKLVAIEAARQRILEEREKMKDPEYRRQKVISSLEHMKSFDKDNNETVRDIPQTDPDTYRDYVIPAFIKCGALPKSDLIDGKKYYGACRNASEAIWHQDKNCFTYSRHKFGFVYDEDINHFEDDDGYDLFVPLKIIE